MADYPTNPSPGTPQPPVNNAPKSSNTVLKVIIAILVLALAGSLYVLYTTKNKSREEIATVTDEKQQITKELEELRSEYGSLQTTNDTINAQLNREKQKIDLLLDKLKKTDASNQSKINEYKKELSSLRDVMKGYIQQIDSLNKINKQLQEENTEYKQQATESQKKIEELAQKSEDLQSKVSKGSAVKVRDITITAVNQKDKDVSKAKQVKGIRTCLVLTANTIADKGTRTIYVRIKSPDGSLLTTSPDNLFIIDDVQLVYSATRAVDYQGDDLDVCIYYSDEDFMSGTYTIEVYMGGAIVGTSQMLLK